MKRFVIWSLTIFCLALLNTFPLKAQSSLDSLEEGETYYAGDHGDMQFEIFTEKIIKISESRRIFALSNQNNILKVGDFFSILMDKDLACRGIVARIRDEYIGVKIVKIYSLKLWTTLKEGMNVKILRGDDSFYDKSKFKKKEKEDQGPQIKSEDDIYDENVIVDDLGEIDQNNKRAIKTDNIISGGYSRITAEGLEGEGEKDAAHFSGSWSYQVADNVWGEFLYGYSLLGDYPSGGLDTAVTDIVVRFKYAIEAPFYSYVLPYVGYQMRAADSPLAGEGSISETQATQELALVDKLGSNSIIFGVTVLRRLVPGWFAKVDLGTDVINVGVALEF